MKTIKYKTIRGLLRQSGLMRNITLAAKRAEEGNITKEERKAGGYQIADYILEEMVK